MSPILFAKACEVSYLKFCTDSKDHLLIGYCLDLASGVYNCPEIIAFSETSSFLNKAYTDLRGSDSGHSIKSECWTGVAPPVSLLHAGPGRELRAGTITDLQTI